MVASSTTSDKEIGSKFPPQMICYSWDRTLGIEPLWQIRKGVTPSHAGENVGRMTLCGLSIFLSAATVVPECFPIEFVQTVVTIKASK